ncbi:MAG: hypothetical protein L6R42_003882 [Xanthoria sp. 1 TBL-2021]|nr:MAG: hypothetical protein L6R42_003882 [Xanthoria sp. 1 TBL-2021]
MDFFRLWMRLFELFRFRDPILQFLGLTERAGKVDDLLKQLGAVMVLHPGHAGLCAVLLHSLRCSILRQPVLPEEVAPAPKLVRWQNIA